MFSTLMVCPLCVCLGATDLHVAARESDVLTVLDVYRLKTARGFDKTQTDNGSRPGASRGVAGENSETIFLDPTNVAVNAGETLTVHVRLADNVTPLFGYSLSIRAFPVADAQGAVTVDAENTSFFLPKNLIAAYPAPLDPVFSVVVPLENGGVFVNANTADLSTVLSTPEVNDVLAEITFAASPDAIGEFVIAAGPATALADGNGFPVDYTFLEGTIVVLGPGRVDPDYNNDGVVDGADLGILLGDWGSCPFLPSDIDQSGMVDGSDLGLLLADWGPNAGSLADFNKDGAVDGADLGNLLSDWGRTTAACADLNADGLVDGADLGILLSAWS